MYRVRKDRAVKHRHPAPHAPRRRRSRRDWLHLVARIIALMIAIVGLASQYHDAGRVAGGR